MVCMCLLLEGMASKSTARVFAVNGKQEKFDGGEGGWRMEKIKNYWARWASPLKSKLVCLLRMQFES